MRRTTPEQRHAHNKKVRQEKARLRRRDKKPRPKKWVYMNVTDIEAETIDKLRIMAKQKKCSVGNLIRQIIKSYMELEKENGIQG